VIAYLLTSFPFTLQLWAKIPFAGAYPWYWSYGHRPRPSKLVKTVGSGMPLCVGLFFWLWQVCIL